MDRCTDVYLIMAAIKEAHGQVNVVNQFPRSRNNSYSNTYNLSWRNYPNFGWRHEGQQNTQQFQENPQTSNNNRNHNLHLKNTPHKQLHK